MILVTLLAPDIHLSEYLYYMVGLYQHFGVTDFMSRSKTLIIIIILMFKAAVKYTINIKNSTAIN